MESQSPLPSIAAKTDPVSRVLLIDDEWEAHDIFSRALRRDGFSFQIDSAYDGEEGISYLERCVEGRRPWPCIVFIDIKMPGATGFDVLEWAHGKGVLGRAVFVMLSSSNEPKDVLRAFQIGAHHYVSKSSPPEVLSDLIKSSMRFALSERAEVTPRNFLSRKP